MLLTDKEYAHVIDLIDKKNEPTLLLTELMEWMKKEFEVQIYDYVCDYIQSGQIRLKYEASGISNEIRQKINQIVSTNDKYNVFSNGVFCDFTSHQTLNEKYRGNLFYYHNR